MNLLISITKTNLSLILSSTISLTILVLICPSYQHDSEVVNFRRCKRAYDEGDKECKAVRNWCKYLFDCPPTIDRSWWEERELMCYRFAAYFGNDLDLSHPPNERPLLKCSHNGRECEWRFRCNHHSGILSKIGSTNFIVIDKNADGYLPEFVMDVKSVVCLVKKNDKLQDAKCGLLTTLRTMIQILEEGDKIITPDQFKNYRVLILADIRNETSSKESQLIRAEFITDACTNGRCFVAKYTFMDNAPNEAVLYNKIKHAQEQFLGRYFGHWMCRGEKDFVGPSRYTYTFKKQEIPFFRSLYPDEGKCRPKGHMFIIDVEKTELFGVSSSPKYGIELIISFQEKSFGKLNENSTRPQLEERKHGKISRLE